MATMTASDKDVKENIAFMESEEIVLAISRQYLQGQALDHFSLYFVRCLNVTSHLIKVLQT